MVQVWAMVIDGTVRNICLWDGNPETWTPPAGATMVLAAEGCTIGSTWDGTHFTPPPPPEPPPEPPTVADAKGMGDVPKQLNELLAVLRDKGMIR